MISLVRAEVRRFLSRRLFRLLALLAVGGILATVVIVFLQSSKDPRAGLEQARFDARMCRQDQARENAQRPPGAPPVDFQCLTVEEALRNYDKRYRYAATMPDTARGISIAAFVVTFAMGASFVGAEWATGSMSTLLTWEPRRGRVLVAKWLAAVFVAVVAVIAVLAIVAAVFYPVAMMRGTTESVTGAFWRGLGGTWLRGAALSAFGVSLAIGLTNLLRNTAGAVAVGFAYGAILDPIASNVLWRGRFREWLLQYNLVRMVGFPVPVGRPGADGSFGAELRTLSVTRPALLFGLYSAVLLLIAYAAFRARDVT